MMKTHEEIKKALECCAADEPCGECPYRLEVDSCIGMIARDALSYIRQLENQVADLGKKVPKWISVKEQPPKDGQKVIATFRDGEDVIVDQARYRNGEFDFADWEYVWDEIITHWMPLPEPPKEEHHD